MTTGQDVRTYVNEGSGPQVNADYVRTINILQRFREIVSTDPLSEQRVNRLLKAYRWTASADQAEAMLRDRNSVILVGPRGSGRWSTAVAVIDKLGVTPHRIDLDPKDKDRDLPENPGCGYIIASVDEETIRDAPGIGKTLAGYSERLAAIGSFLVVTVTNAAWALLQPQTSLSMVAVSPPGSMDIFWSHLTRAYNEDSSGWIDREDVRRALDGASPSDAARLARLAHEMLSTGSSDPVQDALDAYRDWSDTLDTWFKEHRSSYLRALLIAAAALGEARAEAVFGAADELAALVQLDREPGGGLAGEGVARLIDTIGAKETSNGRIRLPRPDYPESVLNFAWRDRPHLRRDLKRWLTELPGNLDDPAAGEEAGRSLIKLAIRQGDDDIIRQATRSWATNRQEGLAAVALTEAALSASTGRATRQHMYNWANRTTTEHPLRLTIAAVCGGPFGKNYPRNAMTRLRRLAIHGGPEIWDQVAIAISDLAAEPHLRTLTLREVVRWTTDDDRLRDAGVRAFLSVANSLAGLTHDLASEEHGLLVSGWRAALRDPEQADAAYQGCAAWLEAVAQGRASRETVLTILADTCQSSLDIGSLFSVLLRWTQSETEPTAVSRYEVANDLLPLIAKRDPLTPGFTPTQIQPPTEDDDQ